MRYIGIGAAVFMTALCGVVAGAAWYVGGQVTLASFMTVGSVAWAKCVWDVSTDF